MVCLCLSVVCGVGVGGVAACMYIRIINFVVCKFYDYVCCVVRQSNPHSNYPVTCSCKTNEQNLFCMNKSKHFLCQL